VSLSARNSFELQPAKVVARVIVSTGGPRRPHVLLPCVPARKTKLRHPLNQRGRFPVLTDAVASKSGEQPYTLN